ncbi:MAG: DUF2070 family protein [Nitrososphaeraceae archaeon]
MDKETDDVSNIHKRWNLTRINFSSYKISLSISTISAIIIIGIFHKFFIESNIEETAFFVLSGSIILVTSYFIDFFLLRRTPLNKIAKVLHVSAFANLLWLTIIVLGLISNVILQKNNPVMGYILEGMMLAIGLRIGIFTSVFGAKILKAIGISIVGPVIFLVSFIPFWLINDILFQPIPILFGILILILGILWTVIADRSGKPYLQSTFLVLQAFLSAWTENKTENLEKILESRSSVRNIITNFLKFKTINNEFFFVLPEIHPGPFKSVGGSKLSYELYKYFSKKAIIFHSISDHSLNIPSQTTLEKYLKSLKTQEILNFGDRCSVPIQVNNSDAIATGILFDKTPLLLLANSPKGMEDIPEEIKEKLQNYAIKLGFNNMFIIDSHNSVGEKLKDHDLDKLLNTGFECLNRIKEEAQYEFKINLANSSNLSEQNLINSTDCGKSGLTVLSFEIKDKNYSIIWIDANNMKQGLREEIINKLSARGIKILEICTSDTHENSGFRTSEGYYTFGQITKLESIINLLEQLTIMSRKQRDKSQFEFLRTESNIEVMGANQFKNYSDALDKAMKITKIFLSITFITILSMLIVTGI